jgi:hypothetical protein
MFGTKAKFNLKYKKMKGEGGGMFVIPFVHPLNKMVTQDDEAEEGSN